MAKGPEACRHACPGAAGVMAGDAHGHGHREDGGVPGDGHGGFESPGDAGKPSPARAGGVPVVPVAHVPARLGIGGLRLGALGWAAAEGGDAGGIQAEEVVGTLGHGGGQDGVHEVLDGPQALRVELYAREVQGVCDLVEAVGHPPAGGGEAGGIGAGDTEFGTGGGFGIDEPGRLGEVQGAIGDGQGQECREHRLGRERGGPPRPLGTDEREHPRALDDPHGGL